MDKTKVDDMLIEMITPKMKQIEEKFGNGEGLTQDDINTLLLKSQYNHINHLDKKLDETVDMVKALESKFESLEGKFETFQAQMKAEFAQFKTDIQETINSTMKWYIGSAGLVLIILKALDLFTK